MKIQLFFIFSLLAFSFQDVYGIGSGGNSAPRDKVLGKMGKWVSTYFTLSAYRNVANSLEPKMKENMTSTEAVTGKMIEN